MKLCCIVKDIVLAVVRSIYSKMVFRY